MAKRSSSNWRALIQSVRPKWFPVKLFCRRLRVPALLSGADGPLAESGFLAVAPASIFPIRISALCLTELDCFSCSKVSSADLHVIETTFLRGFDSFRAHHLLLTYRSQRSLTISSSSRHIIRTSAFVTSVLSMIAWTLERRSVFHVRPSVAWR